jgi:biofilm PGA synthesis protein PgaA
MECDDYEDAYRLIDTSDREQPVWIPLRGSPVPLPNPDRQKADLFAADARMSGGEFDDAADRLAAVAGASPFDTRSQYALGSLALSRGLPRLARLHYEIGKNIGDGHDAENETGMALADLDSQNFQASEAEIRDLVRRFAEQSEVQRAARLLDVHNMAEAQFLSGYGFPPGGSQVNGQTYDFETILYTPPINYNWRLFTDEMFAHGDEPNDEGSVGFLRNSAGIEYREGGLTAEAAPTENIYHATQRPGIGGKADYSLNDAWSIFGSGELFSRDTPIRALNAGVTADEMKFGGQWRENESRSDRATVAIMPFSDGNTQIGFANEFAQGLYASPHWTIDALFDADASQSTANENRHYYNPSEDFLGLIGARATEILYHRYETVYQHTFWVLPGAYWEQHFGSEGALSLRYEHRLRMDDVFEAGFGVNYMHRSYDGAAENDISLSFDLTRRF